MTTLPDQHKRENNILHYCILAIAVLVAYFRIFHAGFMSWDDMDYVFHTPDISSGIGAEQIRHWFSTYYIGNYQPLPVFTYALDHAIGGSNPLVYHLDNILWHIADAILLYWFINKVQPNRMVGLFVALLFALHPVQTESVSWVAARNKGMNAFFFFLAMGLYVDYIKEHNGRKLIWVCVCGFLAYLCKATAVALPLALVAVDIMLQRPLNDKKLWREKLPLVLLAIPIAWATLDAQKQVNFLEHHAQGGGLTSVVYAGYAYMQYIVELLLPINLSVLYPYPAEVGVIHIIYLLVAVGIVALMVVAYRRRWFMLCGGLLFFTVNILPVLQFVQFGEVLMADRYLYIASVGIWLPAVYYLFTWLQSKKKQVIALFIGGGVAAIMLVLTFLRNDIWLSELNFWNSVLDAFPESAVAQYSVGGELMKKGEYDKAEIHLDKAVSIDPNNYKAWHNKGILHMRQGRPADALDALNRSIAINDYNKAYFTRAMLYEGTGKPDIAIADINKVLAAQPENGRAYYIKANCEEKMGNDKAALGDFSRAIQYDSNEPLFHVRRGLLFGKLGQMPQALSDLNNAVALNPANGEALYYRGIVKSQSGQDPCGDLRDALNKGYRQAQEALSKMCGGR